MIVKFIAYSKIFEVKIRMNPLNTLESFMGHIFQGEMDNALKLVADDAVFVSANPQVNPSNKMHGTFIGQDGATQFFGGFVEIIEPGEFTIEEKFSDGIHVAMYGTLKHTVRSTGKQFASNWALMSKIKNGKLTLYHFYEDSEALARAML